MAGHSKWANIKFRKAAQDSKRGKIFTKLIREITVAARQGGGEVADNPRLRTAVDKALGANMTRDTIDRAIARGAGNTESDQLVELSYEGYGPHGVAILVEAMTDNRNRTAAEVRHAFTKNGGSLAAEGSVAYLFSRSGQITLAPGASEDDVMEAAIEAGAEDVVVNEDASVDVTTTPETYEAVLAALRAADLEPLNAEVTLVPATHAELDLDGARTIIALVDMLEDLDDVQNVYTNAEYPEGAFD